MLHRLSYSVIHWTILFIHLRIFSAQPSPFVSVTTPGCWTKGAAIRKARESIWIFNPITMPPRNPPQRRYSHVDIIFNKHQNGVKHYQASDRLWKQAASVYDRTYHGLSSVRVVVIPCSQCHYALHLPVPFRLWPVSCTVVLVLRPSTCRTHSLTHWQWNQCNSPDLPAPHFITNTILIE